MLIITNFRNGSFLVLFVYFKFGIISIRNLFCLVRYEIQRSSLHAPEAALLRVNAGGSKISVEVWTMSVASFGSFVASLSSPFVLGNIELEDGQHAKGFLCEGHAVESAVDISSRGGWRNHLAHGRVLPALSHSASAHAAPDSISEAKYFDSALEARVESLENQLYSLVSHASDATQAHEAEKNSLEEETFHLVRKFFHFNLFFFFRFKIVIYI